jgi:hypothetical protein
VPRRPLVRPSRVVDVLLRVVLVVAVTRLLWTWWGWPGVVVGVPALVLTELLWPEPVEDDEGCLTCGHASIHHHGGCQACLRDRQHGRLEISTPCGRFVRWTPRNRWEELRPTRDARRRTGPSARP